MGGHKVGDDWLLKGKDDGWKTPGGICIYAYNALFIQIQMLMNGGSFPWEPDPDVVLAPCIDSRNRVVFELKRIEPF